MSDKKDPTFPRILQRIRRLRYRCLRAIAVALSYIDHRWYMKIYLRILRSSGMDIVGVPRYIGSGVYFDDLTQIQLGNRVVISNEALFLTHDYSITTALIASGVAPLSDVAVVGRIVLGENVFIGKRALILPNTVIEDNVIIGAGSVVRGRIPANSVAVGNPARVVKTISEHACKCASIPPEDLRYD